MKRLLRNFWRDERGQDVAEYAMMLIIILLLAGVCVKMLGSNVKQVFAKTLVAEDAVLKPGNNKANVMQDCEDAIRQQLDTAVRADFPTVTPEVKVRRIDDNDFRVESFVETRNPEGAVAHIDYSCEARCTQQQGCSVVAELRK